MSLGTGGTLPIRVSPVRTIIEIHNVSDTTVDRKIARNGVIGVPLAWSRPAEQIDWGKIGGTKDKPHHATDSLLNGALRVKSVGIGRSIELKRGCRIQCDDTIVRRSNADRAICVH